jgi:hypothetical protein
MRSTEFSKRTVWAVIFLFTSALSHAAQGGEPFGMNGIANPLLEAVRNDDDAAYRRARDESLRLPPEEFAALLRSLDEAGTWQAMAVRDGLKLRREQPDLAADFDDRLQKTIDNPSLRRDGSLGYNLSPGLFRETTRGLLSTPEHDTLRFEATVTRKVQPDQFGFGGLRWGLAGLTQTDEHTVRRYLAMLEDVPEWMPPENLASRLQRLASRSAHWVDREVPRLLTIYQALRQEFDPSQMGAAIELIRLIAHAAPQVKTPAFAEIHRFEKITMPQQGLQPWAVRAVDDLRNKTRETTTAIRPSQSKLNAMRARGADPEAIERLERELAPIEQQLQRDRKTLGAVRLWQTLEDAIAKTQAVPADKGDHRD